MTPDDILEFAAAGESLTVEFKRGSQRALNDDLIVETVVCLANGDGGTLLLGVEDDGTITGLAPRHGSETRAHLLQAMILNRTDPSIATTVEIHSIGGVDVAVVRVPDEPSPVGTKSGKYVRRTTRADGSPECVPYPLHEMLAAGLSAHGRDYAATPARGASGADLDPAEFDRFRQVCVSRGGDELLADASNSDILRALRLVLPESGNALTLGAILLFGTEEALARYVPTAEVVFHELSQGTIVADDTMRMPLLRTAERLYDLIDVRNDEEELMVGLHRIGIPRIPRGTVRESIANALVHRDYSELGPVSVQLSRNQFRVSSPGGFPSGITLANLLDDSRPRSPILAEAFKRAGIVDRAGRGVREMYQQLLRAGRGEPDYSTTNDRTVIVRVPTSDADLDMVRFVTEYENGVGERLTLVQLRVLHELKATGPQGVSELIDSLHEGVSVLRAQLARLVEGGLVEVRGVGRNRRYGLTAAFYRTAESSEYIRLADTDPIQQERMVLTYVDEFGRITRGKTAELCRLSPDQARSLLRRLVDSGQLELRGEKRGSHYVRPATT
ncbi:MAG: putative DNA binding domain-containing protein [Actinomycetia bacterium]|nr:putative DNA binding domain-containing protein [Actinomycetes bacterium]